MKIFAKGVLLAMLAAMSLTGCGGGGSNNQQGGVFIMAGVDMTPTTYTARVFVYTDNLSGAPITDATVTVNSLPLTYDTVLKYYKGAVLPDVAGKFNLSVVAKGATYIATQNAFTSIPVLTVPGPFTAAAANTITWTAPGGAPAPSSTMFYNLEIVDTAFIKVYVPGSVAATSVTVPANTTHAGTNYIVTLYGTHQLYPIANAASGSSFSTSASATQFNFTAL